MFNFLSSLFCEHEWVVRFQGSFTEGVECIHCGKSELRENDAYIDNPIGWLEEK